MQQAQAGFWLPALADKALRDRFGAPVLARARGLAVGACTPRQQGAARQVLALVQGSRQLYRSQLHLEPGSALRGSCGCAQGELGRACKHQAALALAWRTWLVNGVAPPQDAEATIRLAVAEQFEALADDARASAPQDLITRLQAWRGQNPGWALAAAEQALPLLLRRLDALQAERGWAEDEGPWRTLAEAVSTELFAAWAALGPQPPAYAERYIDLLDADPRGLIDRDKALALLGPELTRRVAQLLRRRWEAGAPADDYLQHLSASGDTDEHLRVLEASRSDAASHAAYVQALLEAGQGRAALHAAEMAQRSFPQDRALQALLLARYEADGWDEEAQALRRQALLREPSRAAYRALLLAGDAVAERTRLWAALAPEPARRDWGSLRLWLCIDEARFAEGLDWLAAHPGFSGGALQDFVQALPETHVEQGIALLKRELEAALPLARPPFSHELGLLRLLLQALSPEAGRLYTSWLRLVHRRRPDLTAALAGLGECGP